MEELFFAQAILPDFIYTEHDVYAILILEVPDFTAARLPNSTGFSRNMMKGGFAE